MHAKATHLAGLQSSLLDTLSDLLDSITSVSLLGAVLFGSLDRLAGVLSELGLGSLGLLLSLLLLLVCLLGGGLCLLFCFGLFGFLTTEHFAPFLLLLGLDLLEQVGGGVELVVGSDAVALPVIGDDEESGVELFEDGTAGGGHVGSDDRSEQVNVVQTQTDDGSAAFGLVLCEGVVELVVLEQLISEVGDVHGCLQTLADLDGIHGGQVVLERFVDFLLVGCEDALRVVVLGVVGHDTLKVGRVDELDDAVDEVTKILEQLVVVRVDETSPLKLGVASLGTSGKEVVTPDI